MYIKLQDPELKLDGYLFLNENKLNSKASGLNTAPSVPGWGVVLAE